jgi:hypothetical protein
MVTLVPLPYYSNRIIELQTLCFEHCRHTYGSNLTREIRKLSSGHAHLFWCDCILTVTTERHAMMRALSLMNHGRTHSTPLI